MHVSAFQRTQRDLWLTRLFYLASLGGTGFIAPFLNLYFVRLGLSGTQIGVVAAAGSIAAMIAAPLWASASRDRPNGRFILQLSLVLNALGYLWLGQQAAFLGIAIVILIRGLAGAGISPLSDSLALSVTGALKSGFGTVRVWASIGWVVAVLSGGWLIERAGFRVAFSGVALIIALGALILFPISPQHFCRPRSARSGASRLREVIAGIWRNPAMMGVAAMMIVIGLGNSGVAQFETVYLSKLGAREGLIGVAGMVSAVVEVPCMLWADSLARRYGAYRLLSIAMLMNAALRTAILLAPSVLSIMAERAIGGISFSFYVVALTGFMGEQTQPQETGTVLALYTVTLANLINIIGSPLAGAAYDAVGTRWLYGVALAGYLVGWACLRAGAHLQRPTAA